MSVNVSIILICHNKYPQNLFTLYSLQKQKYNHSQMEVIFVDDNSTDQTGSLQKYTGPFRFKYFHSKVSLGRAGAKNLGMKMAEGKIVIFLDGEIIGVITLSDKIRDESYKAIEKLQRLGIKCWMLTGDNQRIAQEVSNKLNLDGYVAEVLPHEKLTKIKDLQDKGEFVAMTGDGINDAPALAQADVGIAIGSGTDIAAETADIILVNSNPLDVSSLILFGKATYRKMIQNLFWATAYNVIAIPLAAGVLYNSGIIVSPAIGAALMSLSTVIVSINAQFLKVEKKY